MSFGVALCVAVASASRGAITREFAEPYSLPNVNSKKTAPRHVYESINFYPGQRSVQRAKARWVIDHPNVSLTAE